MFRIACHFQLDYKKEMSKVDSVQCYDPRLMDLKRFSFLMVKGFN